MAKFSLVISALLEPGIAGTALTRISDHATVVPVKSLMNSNVLTDSGVPSASVLVC
jgi:hypothetical protein